MPGSTAATIDLLSKLPGRLRREVSLAPLTTWGIGGPAELYYEPEAVEDLVAATRIANDIGWPVMLLGRGSNVLVDDSGVPGLVIGLRQALQSLRFDTEARELTAEAGVPLPKLATAASRHGIAGFDFLIGIPGTVGAGVAINAGLGGRDGIALDSVIVDADVFDPRAGTSATWDASRIGLRYRGSAVADAGCWVLRARFRGGDGIGSKARERQRAVLAARAAKQPLQRRTAGSVFKQPLDGVAAGWYLDQLGMKGTRVGDAVVSDRHANWIENMGHASSADVAQLIATMRERVAETFGIDLELEVHRPPGRSGHERRPV